MNENDSMVNYRNFIRPLSWAQGGVIAKLVQSGIADIEATVINGVKIWLSTHVGRPVGDGMAGSEPEHQPFQPMEPAQYASTLLLQLFRDRNRLLDTSFK